MRVIVRFLLQINKFEARIFLSFFKMSITASPKKSMSAAAASVAKDKKQKETVKFEESKIVADVGKYQMPIPNKSDLLIHCVE